MRRAYSNALELRRFGRGISWFQEGHSSSSRVTRSRFIALGSRVSSRAPAPENGGGIECRPTSAASTTLGGSAVNGIVSTHSGGGRIEQVPFQVTTARARVLARSAEFQKWFSIAVGTSVYAHAVMLEIAEVGAKISKEEYEEFLPPPCPGCGPNPTDAEGPVPGSWEQPACHDCALRRRPRSRERGAEPPAPLDGRALPRRPFLRPAQRPRTPISALLALLAGSAGKGRDRDLGRRVRPRPAR